MKTNLLLIGAGKFGQKYISTLSGFDDVKLKVATRDNWKKLINEGADGVMVCAPPQSHIEIASYSLSKNIPTMIEKPLSLSLQESQCLNQYSAPILVNHIHLFSKYYQNIKNNIKIDSIKRIWGSGAGPNPQRDYSALWDYGPHDISMILDLSQQYPHTIECEKHPTENQFMITMKFNTFESISCIGHADKKHRYLYVADANDVFVYDGVSPTKDLPLTNALKVFKDAIHGKSDYRLGLDLSLKVMKVLETCQGIITA